MDIIASMQQSLPYLHCCRSHCWPTKCRGRVSLAPSNVAGQSEQGEQRSPPAPAGAFVSFTGASMSWVRVLAQTRIKCTHPVLQKVGVLVPAVAQGVGVKLDAAVSQEVDTCAT